MNNVKSIMLYLPTYLTVHNSDSKNQFFSIVIIEDTIQIITKPSINLLRDMLHSKLLISHPLTIQFNP